MSSTLLLSSPTGCAGRDATPATRPCVILPEHEVTVSYSTLQRVFAGTTFPSWRVVENLLVTGFGLDKEVVDSEWRPLWVAVKDLVDPLDPRSVRSSRSPAASAR